MFDVHVPLRTLLAHYLAGQFVGNVLPSTIGGDVLRVSRCVEDDRLERRRLRVGGDRATERLRRAPAALPLIGFALEPSLLELDHSWIALLIAGITVVGPA